MSLPAYLPALSPMGSYVPVKYVSIYAKPLSTASVALSGSHPDLNAKSNAMDVVVSAVVPSTNMPGSMHIDAGAPAIASSPAVNSVVTNSELSPYLLASSDPSAANSAIIASIASSDAAACDSNPSEC